MTTSGNYILPDIGEALIKAKAEFSEDMLYNPVMLGIVDASMALNDVSRFRDPQPNLEPFWRSEALNNDPDETVRIIGVRVTASTTETARSSSPEEPSFVEHIGIASVRFQPQSFIPLESFLARAKQASNQEKIADKDLKTVIDVWKKGWNSIHNQFNSGIEVDRVTGLFFPRKSS